VVRGPLLASDLDAQRQSFSRNKLKKKMEISIGSSFLSFTTDNGRQTTDYQRFTHQV
jgi:hypothetical protein